MTPVSTPSERATGSRYGAGSPEMRRCNSTGSTSSLRSQYSLFTDPGEVAERLKAVHENRASALGDLFKDNASFDNPLVRVVGDARVILLMYKILHVICTIDYDIKSSFGGRNDIILIESNVTYNWCRPLSFLLRPFSFHLYHSVAIDEYPQGDQIIWKFTNITEVWDFNAISIGAHFLTAPLVKAAGVACFAYEYALYCLAVMKLISF